MRRGAGIPRPAAAKKTTEKRRADRTGSDAPRGAAQTAFGHQVTRPTSPRTAALEKNSPRPSRRAAIPSSAQPIPHPPIPYLHCSRCSRSTPRFHRFYRAHTPYNPSLTSRESALN